MSKKLKSLLVDDTFFTAILVLLVAVVSFGLGRQSVLVGDGVDQSGPADPAGVLFSDAPKRTAVIEKPVSSSNAAQAMVVGSRSGTKYHLPNCPGAAKIKDENKVVFESVELAKAAGYTPAANCPGL